MMDDAARLEARLAVAPHGVQIAYAQHMERYPNDQGLGLNVLVQCERKPVDLLPGRADGDNNTEGLALWSDQEVIRILTDASKIDDVKDRPLGIWEMMRLEQRDTIRRALVQD